jgi:aspartate kinase
MALLIQKFGGTSVGSLARIEHIADIIHQSRLQGHQVVGVVSAMCGETDRLIGLAQQIQGQPCDREYSVLVSTGEQVSMALLCIALNKRGCPAKSYTGCQARIQTTDDYRKARITNVDCEHIRQDLADGYVVVVAGFQGVNAHGDITTLGRGGSDTSAVALAVGLGADECQIYTDVDGVYTADPRIVPAARRLEQVTFEEMLELASLGAKVLQIRAVEFAGKYNVPLRVLSSFTPGAGTLITYEGKTVENPIVSGIAYNRSEAKITLLSVPDRPGIVASIMSAISDANIEIDMIVQNGSTEEGETNLSFTVHRDDYQAALHQMDQVTSQLSKVKVLSDNRIAKLSLVGVGMRSHAGVANTMFKILAEEGINIQLIATSEIKISVVIDEKYLELGVRALHTAFGLDAKPQEEFDPKVN